MNLKKPIVSSFIAWSIGFFCCFGVFLGQKKEKGSHV